MLRRITFLLVMSLALMGAIGGSFGLVSGDMKLSGNSSPIAKIASAIQDGTYSISGTVLDNHVNRLNGVSVSDGVGDVVITGQDGTYQFNNLFPGDYTITSNLDGYTFSPANQQVTLVDSDQTGIFFIGTRLYTIQGNAGAGGVTLSYTDVTPKTITAADDGSYAFTIPEGWYGTVTPSLAGFVFTPTYCLYNDVISDQSNQDYTTTPAYTISGTVLDYLGAALPGVTLTVDASHTATSADDGSYTIAGVVAGIYTVTPSKTGYAFNPSNWKVTVGPNVSGKDFTGTPQFSISGIILDNLDHPLEGVSITSSPAGYTAATAGDGSYSITVPATWNGTLTPSFTGYYFTPPNWQYNNVLADQPDQNYTAIPDTFTPSVTPTATVTDTPTATDTFTPSVTLTVTDTVTATATDTYTPSVTPTVTDTATPTATDTFTPSMTPTATYTATSTATYTFTPSLTPTATYTYTPTPTKTSSPSATPTATYTATATATYTYTPSVTPTATFTYTPTATITSSPSATPTATYTATPTATYTLTPKVFQIYLAAISRPDPNLIFTDDFGFDTGWQPVITSGGEAGIVSSEYRLYHSKPNQFLAAIAPLPASQYPSTGYIVQADMRLLQGANNRLGLVFDWQNTQKFQYFAIRPNTQDYWVYQFANGVYTIITGGNSTNINSALGVTNTLKLVRQQDSIIIYINGVQIINQADAKIDNVQTGLVLSVYDTAPGEARFDKFTVSHLP